MSINIKHPNLIKAIYKHGVFEPAEPIQGLFDDQPVQLQIWPSAYEETDFAETVTEWDDTEDDEWEYLNLWEQHGKRFPRLSPEEQAVLLQWVQTQWASLSVPSDQALEIATGDWLIEENLWL